MTIVHKEQWTPYDDPLNAATDRIIQRAYRDMRLGYLRGVADTEERMKALVTALTWTVRHITLDLAADKDARNLMPFVAVQLEHAKEALVASEPTLSSDKIE